MNHRFDINKLWQEAQTRWLTPTEVHFILLNHEQLGFPITPRAPLQPQSGSWFLFNRRVLRNFRKDEHAWKKKKDGRTMSEAHEKLKVGNMDALNCYYAQGELNPFLRRRIYWMLDPTYDHIAFVHYREVSEGRCNSASISNFSGEPFSPFSQTTSTCQTQLQVNTSGTCQLQEVCENSNSPSSVEEISSRSAKENYEPYHSDTLRSSGQPEANQVHFRKLTEQLSLGDDNIDAYFAEKPPSYFSQFENSQNNLSEYDVRILSENSHEKSAQESSMELFLDTNVRQQIESLGPEYTSGSNQSPTWNYMLDLSSNSLGMKTHEGASTELTAGLPQFPSCRTSTLETQFPSRDISTNDLQSFPESGTRSEVLNWQQTAHEGVIVPENCPNRNQNLESDLSVTRGSLLGSDISIESQTSVSKSVEVERPATHVTFTAVANSRDMTLGGETNIDWPGNTGVDIDNCIFTSDFMETWLDPSQFGNSLRTDSSLTLAQKQSFTITEISPEWAFSSDCSKVIITGEFLCNSSEFPWAVMFGDIEVPVEIVQNGVLRCHAPQHVAGKVTLCITSGNRESCSEIREFEFRAEPNTSTSETSLQAERSKKSDELVLLAKFALSLLIDDAKLEAEHRLDSQAADNQWQQIIETLLVGSKSASDTLDWILQELLKDKFCQWLMAKQKGMTHSASLLSKREQGIIHIISGLGYEWALNPILEFGTGINFRDVNGWTALHWAACFGREKMVAALLAAGSSAGAVTDPTPQDPVGKTPGDIAAASGHTGLAGYLSEVALTSHLSCLTMEESEISKGHAAVEAERAVESISQRSVLMHADSTEDELSLKDSLAAVRNAAQAAARIQAAFRAHSFRKRHATHDEYGLTAEDIQILLSASKCPRAVHFNDLKFDKAALSIQKKFRGWKKRKDFLNLRQRVVKIQALVRGHQVQMKYKEFLWTVGVLEKVVLRWRRKGVGLRGFRAEPEMVDETEEEDIIKVFRKQKVDAALDQAVSRVVSMVEYPVARQQYRRMLEKYRQAKAEQTNVDGAISGLNDDFQIVEQSDYMY